MEVLMRWSLLLAAMLLAACTVTPRLPAALPLVTATAAAATPYPPGRPTPLPTITPLPRDYVPPPTWTPRPAETPWPSSTPGPSPTPSPAWTPWPTPASSPTSRPWLTATPGPLPPITHDLLFLSNGRLVLWNHVAGALETLAGPGPGESRWSPGSVLQFALSAGGTRVALLRTTAAEAANELAALDLATRRLITLATVSYDSKSRDVSFVLSPDGRWLAYAQSGAPGLSIQSVDEPQQTRSLDACNDETTPGCSQLLWLPDGAWLTWKDVRGVWGVSLSSETPELWLADTPRLIYRPVSWSPSGRFLLAIAELEGSDGPMPYALYDRVSGQLAPMPVYRGSGAELVWLHGGSQSGDERLFTMQRRSTGPPATGPTGEIWRVAPESPGLFVREAVFPLTDDPEAEPVEHTAELADGRLAFALSNRNAANEQGRGLYVAAPGEYTPRRLNGVPPACNDYGSDYNGIPSLSTKVAWAPDGSAIVSDCNTLLYVPADGRAPYDVWGVIGVQFAWAP
jgi:hypothetical protein